MKQVNSMPLSQLRKLRASYLRRKPIPSSALPTTWRRRWRRLEAWSAGAKSLISPSTATKQQGESMNSNLSWSTLKPQRRSGSKLGIKSQPSKPAWNREWTAWTRSCASSRSISSWALCWPSLRTSWTQAGSTTSSSKSTSGSQRWISTVCPQLRNRCVWRAFKLQDSKNQKPLRGIALLKRLQNV